jgi:hypothetical protein
MNLDGTPFNPKRADLLLYDEQEIFEKIVASAKQVSSLFLGQNERRKRQSGHVSLDTNHA